MGRSSITGNQLCWNVRAAGLVEAFALLPAQNFPWKQLRKTTLVLGRKGGERRVTEERAWGPEPRVTHLSQMDNRSKIKAERKGMQHLLSRPQQEGLSITFI